MTLLVNVVAAVLLVLGSVLIFWALLVIGEEDQEEK